MSANAEPSTFTMRRAGQVVWSGEARSFQEAVALAAGVPVDELHVKAERVAAAKAEGDEARGAIDGASADLLERVVDAVRSALPALCSKVDGDADGEPMMLVAASMYDRARLFLTQRGEWWVWCRSDSGLVGGIRDAATVAKGWHVPTIIERVASALESHDRGNASATAEKMRERAERIRAVATLLGGGK